MEELKLDPYKGIFKVEGLRRIQWDDCWKKNMEFAMQVKPTENGWEFSVASAPTNNEDIPYMIINDEKMAKTVIDEALPILIREMERREYKQYSVNLKESDFYRQAAKELTEVYYAIREEYFKPHLRDSRNLRRVPYTINS